MSAKSNAERLNDAIVKKLDKVLKNTDHIDSIRIVIEGSFEECPTIYYQIKERISSEGGESDSGFAMKESERYVEAD